MATYSIVDKLYSLQNHVPRPVYREVQLFFLIRGSPRSISLQESLTRRDVVILLNACCMKLWQRDRRSNDPN